MRIACLQFAPNVGDVDNNLSRADAILDKADLDDLLGLDLLVLPELAFTGYNFKSLQHISPYFENAGSGITSLWARTSALKYDCTVVAGYPEKVDVDTKWPASPESYNSALVVDGDGEIIGNYRKSFLYDTDETWALEGPDGFFQGEIPGFGNAALGICTDLNPYRLEAPWDAFEFGYHILDAEANLVILTMAWQTHQDPTVFSRNPKEPDLETLVYWIQRLEPLIRADNEDEIIVVFCNRTGVEDDATYTGTSAVIGIKLGEVFVYGVLGRQEDGLLVVDTDNPPVSKLTDADAAEADNHTTETTTGTETGIVDAEEKRSGTNPDEIVPSPSQIQRAGPGNQAGLASPRSPSQIQCAGLGNQPGLDSPRTPGSPRLPWLAPSDEDSGTPTNNRSPTRLQIPTRPDFDRYLSIDSAVTDIAIDTPISPQSTRRPYRAKSSIPSSPWRFPNRPSPYPWHSHDGSHSAVFGSGATMTPITPFDEDMSLTPIDPKPPQWFWKHEPTLSALAESIKEEDEEEEENTSEPPQPRPKSTLPAQQEKQDETLPREPQKTLGHESGIRHEAGIQQVERGPDMSHEESEETTEEPSPRNDDWADLSNLLEELKLRPSSSFNYKPSHADRPGSTKSWNVDRNFSRPMLFQPSELGHDEWDEPADEGVTDPDGWDGTGGRNEPPNAHWRNPFHYNEDQNANSQRMSHPRSNRHAVFFPDDDDDDEDQLFTDLAEGKASQLSLHSATSVSTVGDDDEELVTPKMMGGAEGLFMAEPVIGRDCGVSSVVSLETGKSAGGNKRGEWPLGTQARGVRSYA